MKTLNSKFKKGLVRLVLGLTLATGVALGACSPAITKGTIIEKIYEPEREWTSIYFMPISTGDSYIYVPVTQYNYDDEDFVLKVEGYNKEKGKYLEQCFYVDEETYNNSKIGEYFVYNKETVSLFDSPEKRKAKQEEIDRLGITKE